MGQAWQSRVCLLTLKLGSLLLMCSLRVAGWWVDLLQPVTCMQPEVKTDVSKRRRIPPLPLKLELHADISRPHLNPLGTSSSTIQASFMPFSSLQNLFIQLVLSASVWVRDHPPEQGQPAVATPLKTDSSPSSHQLPIAPQLGVGPDEPLPNLCCNVD